MDLRRQKRFAVQLQSIMIGAPRKEWAGVVMNLSKTGCLIECDAQVYAGMSVAIRIEVPAEAAPLLIDRAAVRWNRGRQVGVSFVSITQPQQERLNQLLLQVKPEISQ
ncbi:MAG: PilZ domain-containing protein [Nitrospira sp.]|nr:PilZ domain-containing protein [Nitrospira sp.]